MDLYEDLADTLSNVHPRDCNSLGIFNINIILFLVLERGHHLISRRSHSHWRLLRTSYDNFGWSHGWCFSAIFVLIFLGLLSFRVDSISHRNVVAIFEALSNCLKSYVLLHFFFNLWLHRILCTVERTDDLGRFHNDAM